MVVAGANGTNSIWVFTLIAMEAVKTYKSNPYFMLGTTQIPTWITPLVMVLFVSVLIPNTSFLGHVCGLSFGYGCMWFSHVGKDCYWLYQGLLDISSFSRRLNGPSDGLRGNWTYWEDCHIMYLWIRRHMDDTVYSQRQILAYQGTLL